VLAVLKANPERRNKFSIRDVRPGEDVAVASPSGPQAD
jgi:hypothetical protein